MRRLWVVLLLLVTAGAQAQGLGFGPGLFSSGPNLIRNADGTYSAPGSAAIKTQAGSGTGTTLPTGVLCRVTTAQATTGTSEQVLATCTIPASTLSADGMGLRYVAWGTTAANGNTKIVRLRFGGIAGSQLIANSTTASGVSWLESGVLVRTGAATQIAGSTSLMGGGPNVTSSSPTQTLSGDVDLVVTATTGTSAGDLTCVGLVVELLR